MTRSRNYKFQNFVQVWVDPPAPQWACDAWDEFRAAMAAPEWRDVPPPLSLLLPVSQRAEAAKKQKLQQKFLNSLVAKAKQLGVNVTVEPNGALTLHTGSSASAPVDKLQNV